MADSYITIAASAEGIYKEKGSKFLSFAHPVSSLDEVKILLEQYRKDYFDARHICYAYMLGPDRLEFRANDDGEPSGTAGRPILGQINSKGLTNILVVVIRYFGGILLGTGGLIVAYKEATQDALNHAQIVERDVMISRHLSFPYEKMNEIMRVLKDIQAHILQQGYEDGLCTIDCEIRQIYHDRI
ncbi:MAG: YigZ family protein [Paludibacteraceae bacterium]|nr:YigZ family protein [Paludibacteraceae bacterium]